MPSALARSRMMSAWVERIVRNVWEDLHSSARAVSLLLVRRLCRLRRMWIRWRRWSERVPDRWARKQYMLASSSGR